MGSKDVKCRYCGEITGINFDVCEDCADKLLDEIINEKQAESQDDDIPF